MTDITEIGAERLKRAKSAADVTPSDVLTLVQQRIASGQYKPDHIVVIGIEGSGSFVLNGGGASTMAVTGAIYGALHEFGNIK